MSTNKKISVIIPVYNVEQYLRQCLDSVINQSLKDIEIILVDDGSTDSSLSICKEYAQKDSRIKIFEQKNLGSGAARNKGIKSANSEFVIFMDSDDYYPQNDILETLYNKAKENNVLICGGSFSILDNNQITNSFENDQTFEGYTFNSNGLVKYEDYQFDYGYHRFIYNLEFLKENDLYFPDYKRFQDPPFFIKTMYKAGSFYALQKVTYLLRCGHKTINWTKDKKEGLLNGIADNLNFAKTNKLDKLYYLTCERLNQHAYIFSTKDILNFQLHKIVKSIDLSIPQKFNKEFKLSKDLLFNKQLRNFIFSLTNQDTHKVLTILGISIKFKRNPICFIKHIDKNKLKKQLNTCEYGITTKKRTPQLIVSLTSFPQRMYDIHFCLYSLLNQSLKPDRLILWLAEEEFPNKEKDIPNTVLSFLEKGLEIKWCKNIKSYKKLIPALKEYPDAITVTADDDIYYPVDWLEKLYQSYQKNPEYIHCHRAHKILFDTNNTIMPYKNWESETTEHSPSLKIFCTTGGGVLYPPQCLYKDVLNEELFTKLAPNADDIWFWAMALLQGTKIKVVDDNIKQLTYINPERELGLNNEITLCSQNCGNGQNDIQLANVLKQYPQIMEKLINE